MADPIPFRLAVLQALSEHLKTTVTPDNGYVNDLSDFDDEGVNRPRVSRGRDEFGETDPKPQVSILEHPDALERLLGRGGSTSAAGDWDLVLTGVVADDELNPTDPAQILAADVTKALAILMAQDGDILGFGNRKPCVTGIRIGAPVCRPADGMNSDWAFFVMRLTLTLAEDLSQPFLSS